jgi:glycosyltransferase involved in cell wall biosynthesis
MRLLCIHFGPFDCNSAIQAFHFGNLLCERGWEVILCADGDPADVERVGEPAFECVSRAELPGKLGELARVRPRTVFCAWTPREQVRRLTLAAAERLGAPYVVHLEDNEEHLLEAALGRSIGELRGLPVEELAKELRPNLAHPSRYLEFVRDAAGVTGIVEELSEFNAAARPWRLIRPGIDAERFAPDVAAVERSELGLRVDEFVLVYHGNIHYANQHEMLSLYLAVQLLHRRGWAVRLVRLGQSLFGGPDPHAFRALAEGVVELGEVPWREVPPYLALADAYVQPGAADSFNRYRLPSKLPEFLAMGRPVVLPRCNLGLELEDGRDALLLERGDAIEIADRVEELIDDPDLAARLGHEGRRFAVENLNWERNAEALDRLLKQSLTD